MELPNTTENQFKIISAICLVSAVILTIGAALLGVFPMKVPFWQNALLGFAGSLITTSKINLFVVYMIQPKAKLSFYINFVAKLVIGVSLIGYLFTQEHHLSKSAAKQAFFATLVENLYSAIWGMSLGLALGTGIIYLTIKMTTGGSGDEKSS